VEALGVAVASDCFVAAAPLSGWLGPRCLQAGDAKARHKNRTASFFMTSVKGTIYFTSPIAIEPVRRDLETGTKNNGLTHRSETARFERN
jgi:hypothetical protein